MAAGSEGKAVERLTEIVRTLRGPGGCPWDREQTLESLRPNLIEEAYELIDAIDSGDRSALREELGDVLLQVVFQSRLCEEEGAFGLAEVADGVVEKLVRRHPHVFGETEVSGSEEVLRNWDAIKRREKQGEGEAPASVLAGVPRHLPALMKAAQVQKRAARSGFDWARAEDVTEKLREEVGELCEAVASGREDAVREELGDLLFSAVNVARFLGHDPEELLNRNVEKFSRRFRFVEERTREAGRPMSDFSLEELDGFWEEAKRGERDFSCRNDAPSPERGS